MAVRFSKLKTINLDNADEEEAELLEPEPSETDGGVWNNINADEGEGDEGTAKLILEDDEAATEEVKRGRLPSWMNWKSRGSYAPMSMKRRRRRKCPCNSWKAVAIAVLVFTVVFLISLIISVLIPEPSEGKKK